MNRVTNLKKIREGLILKDKSNFASWLADYHIIVQSQAILDYLKIVLVIQYYA